MTFPPRRPVSPGRPPTPGRLLLAGIVSWVLAACSAGDGDTAAGVAERYADALTAGSSRSLAEVTCDAPSSEQARRFEERAGAGTLTWTVARPPEPDGDSAHGVLRASDGQSAKDYPFTLHKRQNAWCAHYNWARLDQAG